MTSQTLWNYIQYIGNLYPIQVTSQLLFCVITPTVLTTSHPIILWHHTRYMYGIFCIIHDITSTLYDIKPPFLWHHTHCIWHHIHCTWVITSTVWWYHTNYLWDLIRYIWRHHMHCIRHHIQYICNITATVSVSSHPLFRCYHTLCMYDITPLFV